MKISILTILFCFIQIVGFSQSMTIDFTLNSEDLIAPTREYGSGVSFFDVNKDGFDDITFPNYGDSILLLLSNGDSFTLEKIVRSNGNSKMVLWTDFDNDGDYDLFVTYNEARLRLFRNNGDLNMQDVTGIYLPVLPNLKTYGISAGDFNNDGFLDYYVANYNFGAEGSWLLMNQNGNGFIEVGAEYGINVNSDASFQATVIDLNGDGKQDIHVANDRYPRDAVLINEDSYFNNIYSQVGFDIYCNSMSTSFNDFDHDGDMDLYITNSYEGNFLWERQEELMYEDVAQEKNVALFRESWGALWIDVDNDTWDDLYVNNIPQENDPPPFFMNQQGTFEQSEVFTNYDGPWYSFAAAKGDFNNDGYYDMALNMYDDSLHRFVINNGGENNYVKVMLEGQISNRDGVGSWIEYYINANHYIQHVEFGNAYLTQDSQWKILGLGQEDVIDSLLIKWPSGIIDRYYAIPANTTHVFLEGYQEVMLSINNQQIESDSLFFCAGNEVGISANAIGNFLWNDQSTSSTLSVDQSTWIYLAVTDDFGIINISDSVYIQFIELPEISLSSGNVSCFGANDGWIAIAEVENSSISINNEQANLMYDLSSGIYNVLVSNQYGCSSAEVVEILEPDPLFAEILSFDITCFGLQNGSVEINNIAGGNGGYETALYSENSDEITNWSQLNIGNYQLVVTDQLGCSFFQEVVISQPSEISIDLSYLDFGNWYEVNVSGGEGPYQIFVNEEVVENGNAVVLMDGLNFINVADWNDCTADLTYEIEPPVINQIASLNEKITSIILNEGMITFSNNVFNVAVYDLIGKLVFTDSNPNYKFQCNLSKGIYLISYTDNFGTHSKKIIFE